MDAFIVYAGLTLVVGTAGPTCSAATDASKLARMSTRATMIFPRSEIGSTVAWPHVFKFRDPSL